MRQEMKKHPAESYSGKSNNRKIEIAAAVLQTASQ
jgi:hypothetical protein